MTGSRLPAKNISRSELKFSSSGRSLNTPAPPLPNSGFTMMSQWVSRKARMVSVSRLINVGGIRSGNRVTKSFSGALRTSAGLFTTIVAGGNKLAPPTALTVKR